MASFKVGDTVCYRTGEPSPFRRGQIGVVMKILDEATDDPKVDVRFCERLVRGVDSHRVEGVDLGL